MKTLYGVTEGFVRMRDRCVWQLAYLKSIADGTVFNSDTDPYGALDEVKSKADEFLKEWNNG